MIFFIIYSFDCEKDISVKRFQPRKSLLKKMQMTEGDSEFEGYNIGENGKHRKYCAEFTREEFEQFLDDTFLCAENIETMGSIGFPSLGVSPAISFIDEQEEYALWKNAYVTPVPFNPLRGKPIEKLDERNWQHVRRAVINQYGY